MRWSENEVEILKEKYPKQGIDIPGLDRSDQAIVAKAERLGLYSYNARRKEISDEELKNLRDKGLTYQEISDELDVSKSYVYSRFKTFSSSKRLKPSKVKDLSETEKAYIAGIVDGEGCIGLWERTQQRNDWSKTSIMATVRVGMTSKKTIKDISESIGTGSFNEHERKAENEKKQYVFSIQAQNEVKDLLKQIKPFLREKQEQAEKVITYCENREPHKPHTEKEFEMVEELKDMRL